MALTFSAHPHHSRAVATHADATSEKPAFFCRATQQSFLRLVTTPVILKAYGAEGLTNREALQIHESLSRRQEIAFLEEPAGIQSLWFDLAALDSASAKVWMDAYLAAFAIRHGLTFATLDGDFRKFESRGLKLRLLTP
ncbi:TA system VapC family ribonuclease toxin [Luteolibacter sp. Populi]|uniref:TA system VapC family ribonuclease toxin n=1 Tax=Luteolibacter sp. Populi TaxID=3230487 RepID=UPI003466904B